MRKNKPVRSRKRRLIRLVLALVFSIVLVAVLLEAGIRVFDPLGTSHFSDMIRYNTVLCNAVGPPRILVQKPGFTMKFRGFEISTNSLGLRGPELAVPKPENEYRLLFLGDSVVLGWGTGYEDLFTALAQQELNESAEHGTGNRYRCVNSGHNQYDTTQEAALLEELGDLIEPDALILVYVNNDVNLTIKIWNTLVEAGEEIERNPPSSATLVKQKISGWLRGAFMGINNMQTLLLQGRDLATKEEKIKEKQSAVDAEGWEASRAALLDIKRWCEDRDIPFVVLNHTRPASEGKPAEIAPLVPFLKSEEIPCFAFHFTQEEMELPIRNSFSDAHANARGQKLLLEKLRPALRCLGLKTGQ